jgi:hypothetical protein
MNENKQRAKHEQAQTVWGLKKQILALLAPYPMEVQQVVLADAVAMQIANMQPKPPFNLSQEEVQLAALSKHTENVIRMVPVNREILREAKERKKVH